jgi:hypothetical protein
MTNGQYLLVHPSLRTGTIKLIQKEVSHHGLGAGTIKPSDYLKKKSVIPASEPGSPKQAG